MGPTAFLLGLIVAVDRIPESRVREATSRVFARPHFSREPGVFDGWRIPIPDWPAHVWWTLVAVTLLMVVIAAFARRMPQGSFRGAREGGASRLGSKADYWQTANDLASRGEYTLALHAMFAALVSGLSRDSQVDPHPAKTVGDYARELSARRSSVAAPFHAFAAQYERALYGDAAPDRAAFDSLVTLATPLLSRERAIR